MTVDIRVIRATQMYRYHLPAGGLVAARFRYYKGEAGPALLHDHLLLSVKGQRTRLGVGVLLRICLNGWNAGSVRTDSPLPCPQRRVPRALR